MPAVEQSPLASTRADRTVAASRASSTPAGTPILELRDVSMRFGSVTAVDGVDLTLRAGDVTALLGDNGAGKSTVVKIVSGVHTPTSGTIVYQGKEVVFRSAKAARRAGISTVYQDLALVPTMNVWRNFFLGAELRKGLRLDVKTMRAETARMLEEIGALVTHVSRSGSRPASRRELTALNAASCRPPCRRGRGRRGSAAPRSPRPR